MTRTKSTLFYTAFLFLVITNKLFAQITFPVSTSNNSFTLTCKNPSVILNTSLILPWPPYICIWYSPNSASVSANNLLVSQPGNYTVSITSPWPFSTFSLQVSVYSNTIQPTGSVSPISASASCIHSNSPVFNLNTFNPSPNYSSFVLAPFGGTFMINAANFSYQASSPGTYTFVVLDNSNDCKSESYFTVLNNPSMQYSTGTVAGSFTTGCGLSAILTCPWVSYQGPVTYTVIGPNTSSIIPSGSLSVLSTYSLAQPGNYTFVVSGGSNFCTVFFPLTIIGNTTAPGASITPNSPILTCSSPTLSIGALTTATNVSYQWALAGSGNTNGPTLAVSTTTTSPTNTLFNTCTLTTTNLVNQCKSTFSFSIFRNVFQPVASISATPTVLGCGINTIVLKNSSGTGIPTILHGIFGNGPIGAYLWQGPPPQQNVGFSSLYLATTPGVYTLTAMDLANDCKSNTTLSILYDALCTGLKSELLEKQIRVYPNPVCETLHLEFDNLDLKELKLSIQNALGQIVYNAGKVEEESDNYRIDVSFLPSGIYYLKLQNEKGQKIVKLLKE